MKKILILLLTNIFIFTLCAQQKFELTSPDGFLRSTIKSGEQLTYNIMYGAHQILKPSLIAMRLSTGQIWGEKCKLKSSKKKEVNQLVPSPFYRTTAMGDHYNELTLDFRGDYSVEFRAYNDGIAYRFVNKKRDAFQVVSEQVEYHFSCDEEVIVPYVRKENDCSWEEQFFNSFENVYSTTKLSEINKTRLMFLPLIVNVDKRFKVCITESHLEDYPGLYLSNTEGGYDLKGVFAPYPKREEPDPHKKLQMLVQEREHYIAKVEKPRTFPWRIAIVAKEDKALPCNNLTYLLGSPSRVEDISWIKPGKVAWEWWNDWNLEGVDFVTGVNNATYKAYIDFAASKGIEYVILDEGWAVNGEADLMQVVKEINLQELINYATVRNVGIILWAGYHAFERDMENVCRHYAALGIKGFKVDFMDRDDQMVTAFNYRAAATCAKYKLLLDLHGTHKPAGLNRTYPNVLNFEGVHGLEQLKWSPASIDQVKYDVTVPFIRQVSGPMDYTQGAMRNAVQGCYYPCNSEPMSQGTRCHQLALYIVFDSPLNMLCDSPSNYLREQESTDFIAEIPTVWDETIVLEGKMGEYVITARRKGDVWYVGGITDWNKREMIIDLSFLPDADYCMELFCDGINAHRKGSDYLKKMDSLPQNKTLLITMSPGGGFAAKIKKKDL
ncbi:glycoside hydrolase family 97 protein [Bacteroides congonensis]|uniref:glycoside hydrolase family 97 protein n=1 Tax=Bacteroides congonensis TaxID=1871006 RepID=UPI0018A01F0B|nr:glycoside hydrolase family 97 protein [Bacteroides congonensis]